MNKSCPSQKAQPGGAKVAANILNSAGGEQWWRDVGAAFVHYAYVQDYMAKNGADLPPLTDLSPWQRESVG